MANNKGRADNAACNRILKTVSVYTTPGVLTTLPVIREERSSSLENQKQNSFACGNATRERIGAPAQRSR
jgi:hypothetical protein